MKPAKKITIISLKKPQKLADDFVPKHMAIVTEAVENIFTIALEVATNPNEPSNNLVPAASVRFCRALVCTDVASSAERLVVNNAAPQLWEMLRRVSDRHADEFRDAVLITDNSNNSDNSASSASSSSASNSQQKQKENDIAAMRKVARLWICWAGAVHFAQHLLSWMEKSGGGSAGEIRATCFSVLSTKLAAAGTRVLNAAIRGFMACLWSHRAGDAAASSTPIVEMTNLKNVMLQCRCYGDAVDVRDFFNDDSNSNEDAHEEQEDLTGRANLQLYFLPTYLRETRKFYSREAANVLSTSTGSNTASLDAATTTTTTTTTIAGGTGALCEHFAYHVHRRLNDERDRSQQFLASFSRAHADAVVQRALIAPPFDEVIDRDFAAALAKTSIDSAASAAASGSTVNNNSNNSGGGLAPQRSVSSSNGSGLLQTASSAAVLTSASSGLAAVSTNNDAAVLHRLYVLASLPHVGKLPKLRLAFKQYASTEAANTVASAQGAAAEAQMIPNLLSLYAKLETLIAVCFRNDSELRTRFRESIAGALRARQSRVAELVAKQFDTVLREGDKTGTASAGTGSGTSADATVAALERLARFARLVPACDVLETFFMRDLGKRLLHFRAGVNEDLEHLAISRLKGVCGPTIATRCNGMMKDIELSRDFVSGSGAAAEKLREADPQGRLEPLVLTAGYWPTTPDVAVPIPNDLATLTENFSRLYQAEFKRRKLVWSPLLSSAVVKAQFPRGGSKELTVSFLQAHILVQLSGRPEPVSEEELRASFEVKPGMKSTGSIGALPTTATGDDESNNNNSNGGVAGREVINAPEAIQALNEALQCAIFSLVSAKIIIAKDTQTNLTNIAKSFIGNRDFTSRQTKIRVAQVQLRAQEETQQVVQNAMHQRTHTVDAALAKIMKARKRVPHAELVTQTIEITKLPLDPADVKKRIEGLIDKGFMQRDTEDPSWYVFIA